MTVLVSACLLGENCKYNGGNNASPAILEFLKDKQVIPICPELLAGMPSPQTAGRNQRRPCHSKKRRRCHGRLLFRRTKGHTARGAAAD